MNEKSTHPPADPWWTAVRRGLGLGIVFSLVEALKNIPLSLKFHYVPPLETVFISLLFNLGLALSLSLLAAPLLNRRRGSAWHAAAVLVSLTILYVATPQPLDLFPAATFGAAAAVAVFYLLGLWLAGGPWRRHVGMTVGLAGLVAAYAVPYQSAPALAGTPGTVERTADPAAPNVLLIILDTVRADRLDIKGYHRATFPWLGTFAAEGADFDRAISPAPWTVPSHASIFTGLYPSGHGAHHENKYLRAETTTLAEILHQNGWETLSLSANPWISKSTGLTQGFAIEKPVWINTTGVTASFAYRIAWNLGLITTDHSGRAVTDAWLGWLDRRDESRPFFAMLNYLEPHFPFHHLPENHLKTFSPEDVERRDLVHASKAVMETEMKGEVPPADVQERVNELYDSAIRYEADLIQEAVMALEERDELDRTLVILVSDHGELLGEHGMFNHTRSLSEYLLSVPLLMRYPPRIPPGLKIETPVTTAALLPTILDLAGVAAPENLHTRSFAALFDPPARDDWDENSPDAANDAMASALSPLLSENYRDPGDLVLDSFTPRGIFDRLGVRYRSLEEGEWKLVVDSEGHRWLFRPREDPREVDDLADEYPEIVDRLSANLDTLVGAWGFGQLDAETAPGSSTEPEMDPELRKQLEALGYVG